MEKPMTSYETMFIVDSSKGIDAAKELVAKFTDLIAANGTINKIVDLGVKKLAYEINDMREGYYTLVYFDSKQSFPSELSRVFNITDGVMRSLIIADSKAPEDVVIPEDVPAPEEEIAAPVEESAPAEEAPIEETVPAEEETAEEATAEEQVEETTAEEATTEE